MPLGVETEHLELHYGSGRDQVRALADLSFSLEGGKIYGLLGRNGSGKTSLLSVLAAFRKASGGTVRIGGQPVFENPAVTRQLCLIRETGDPAAPDWPDDKVQDALDFAAYFRPAWDAGVAADLVERFHLPRDRRIGQLSLGQRSALGVVLGLATRAPVTMFDESHLGMDAPSRYVFYEALLEEFMAHPRTVILSTHLVEEVNTLFEEVVVIDRGRLLLHQDADTLRSQGATVTGPAEAVDAFVAGMVGTTVLSTKQLGATRSVTVYGPLDDRRRAAAQAAGLELGPVPLQDLFVHLTEPTGTLAAAGQGAS